MLAVVYLLMYLINDSYGVTISAFQEEGDCIAALGMTYQLALDSGHDLGDKLACRPITVNLHQTDPA